MRPIARTVLSVALMAATGAATAAVIPATPASPATSTPVTPATPPAGASLPDGVRLLRGTYAPPAQPDGNSVMFQAPDGWVVVDTGRHPAHVDGVREIAGATPVRVVVNTHWHLDHVSGNPALRTAYPGLEVVASPAIDDALKGFLADYARNLRRRIETGTDPAQADAWRAELARIENGDALRPDRVVEAGGPITLAGREFEIGLETDAVTAGDVWLFDRERGVLAAGDLVTLPAPFLDTACPARWQAALGRLADVPFTSLVPGHGARMNRGGLQTWRGAFDNLLACAAGDAPEAACVEGWLADAAPLLPDEASRSQARSLLQYYVPNVLRGDAAGRWCPAEGPPR